MKIGDRVRLTDKGVEQGFYQRRGKAQGFKPEGVIVSVTARACNVRVLVDNCKTPETYHESYWEKIAGPELLVKENS